MRNGFKVYDSDTHVIPAAEVLEWYVDPSFRPKLEELAPYRLARSASPGAFPDMHLYSVQTKYYRRVLGEATPSDTFTGRTSRWMGSQQPRPGVQDDNAADRVLDMDEEGADVHLLVPSTWTSIVGLEDPEVEVGLTRAYHRHMADFCGQYPDRLKGMILASGISMEEAVGEIHRWGNDRWAVAVMPIRGFEMPVDRPDLEPIWKAAAEHDLPIVHHSSTWNPPHFPGYWDMWDNIFLGRLASHPGAP